MGEEFLLVNTHMGKQLLNANTLPMILLGTNSQKYRHNAYSDLVKEKNTWKAII